MTRTINKKNILAEVIGVVGVIALFSGCWLQFGLPIALIVLGFLFVCTSIASALRG